MMLHGDLAAIPTITVKERTALLQAAHAFNAHLRCPPVVSGRPRSRAQPVTGIRPGDVSNTHADWRVLLALHGWTRVREYAEVTYWRPGKIGPGAGATTNYAGSRLPCVFSTNAAPFEPDTAYTLFAAYAMLEHRGDFTAAARSLARRGSGECWPGDRRPEVDPWLGPRAHRHGVPLAVQRVPSGAMPHA
jgi:hypothetical protein